MIYLDHVATTEVAPEVLKKMLPWLKKNYGNPSSIYKLGREARLAVEGARNLVAENLNATSKEIVFTGSGTEANNWAIFGLAEAYGKLEREQNHKSQEKTTQPRNHIIATKIEHHSVLHPLQQLERKGFRVTWLEVDDDGLISLEALEKAITPETIFASIIYANNEIGTIQPLAEISRILHKHKVILHTDACQAPNYLSLDTQKLGIDVMTLDGSKIYGPKGVGVLCVNKKIKITPLLYGGGQELRRRAGTENVPAIVGFANALQLAQKFSLSESARLSLLRDQAIHQLLKIPGIRLNGHPGKRLPNNINISIYGVDGESLLMRLDLAGIAASSGSACTSGSLDPSHVLQALRLPPDLVKNSLRLTLGRKTSKKELQKAIKILLALIKELRLNHPSLASQ